MLYPLILRIIHIGAGVIWAGAAFMITFVMQPNLARKGPDGPRQLGQLLMQGKYSLAMGVVGVLTVLSGILLWLRNTAWFAAINWAQTGTGVTFTVGAVLGILALIVGGAFISPASARMGRIGAELAQQQGPPPPEKLAEMQQTGKKLQASSLVNGVLLVLTVIAMATAQYIR